MAEFSEEYLLNNGWEDWEPDFSILAIYNSMKDGEVVQRICEGYGFTAIKKVNNNCILEFTNKEVFAEDIFELKN